MTRDSSDVSSTIVPVGLLFKDAWSTTVRAIDCKELTIVLLSAPVLLLPPDVIVTLEGDVVLRTDRFPSAFSVLYSTTTKASGLSNSERLQPPTPSDVNDPHASSP